MYDIVARQVKRWVQEVTYFGTAGTTMVSTSASLSGGPCAMVATATAASIPTMLLLCAARIRTGHLSLVTGLDVTSQQDGAYTFLDRCGNTRRGCFLSGRCGRGGRQ
jgi:hypothetical protein